MKMRSFTPACCSAAFLLLAATSLPVRAQDTKAPAPDVAKDLAVPTASEFAIKGLTPSQWVSEKTVVRFTTPAGARTNIMVTVDDQAVLISNLQESLWTLDPAKYLKDDTERRVTLKVRLFDRYGEIGECSLKVQLRKPAG